MKHFIMWVMCITLACLMGCQAAKAQDNTPKREGKTFIATSTRGASSSSDILTEYTWKDTKGNEYPLWLHKYAKGEKAGSYTVYVVRKSAKTGNDYKYCLKDGEAIAKEIMKEMGIN